MHITLTREGNTLFMQSGYDQAFVDDFKGAIQGRSWDKDRKQWYFGLTQYEHFVAWCTTKGHQLTDRTGNGGTNGHYGAVHIPHLFTPPGLPADLCQASITLGLIPARLSLEVAQAVFRCLAKHTHPDVGGDRDTFEQYSTAIAIIRNYLA